MAADNRRNADGLIEDLVKNGHSYSVWQAVWLAENITKNENPERKDYIFDQAGLKFRPSEKYEYPPSDIKSVYHYNGEVSFVLTFLGLYGINSPLPRCYHEQVAMQQRILGDGEVPLQNFFDIFNNRFYWLYYQSWKKYRFYLHLNNKPGDRISERINSFIGRNLSPAKAGMATIRNKESYLNNLALLKFSGILSSRVRSKAGLKIMLNYFFSKYKMDINEFVPQWIELTEIPAIGEASFSLGTNSFIGKYSRDCMSRICIQLKEISFEKYLEFLPGTENSNKLIELLNLYLTDGIEFDFEFNIEATTIAAVSWGDERLKLGSTFWLGKPEKEEVKVYLSYEEIISANLT